MLDARSNATPRRRGTRGPRRAPLPQQTASSQAVPRVSATTSSANTAINTPIIPIAGVSTTKAASIGTSTSTSSSSTTSPSSSTSSYRYSGTRTSSAFSSPVVTNVTNGLATRKPTKGPNAQQIKPQSQQQQQQQQPQQQPQQQQEQATKKQRKHNNTPAKQQQQSQQNRNPQQQQQEKQPMQKQQPQQQQQHEQKQTPVSVTPLQSTPQRGIVQQLIKEIEFDSTVIRHHDSSNDNITKPEKSGRNVDSGICDVPIISNINSNIGNNSINNNNNNDDDDDQLSNAGSVVVNSDAASFVVNSDAGSFIENSDAGSFVVNCSDKEDEGDDTTISGYHPRSKSTPGTDDDPTHEHDFTIHRKSSSSGSDPTRGINRAAVIEEHKSKFGSGKDTFTRKSFIKMATPRHQRLNSVRLFNGLFQADSDDQGSSSQGSSEQSTPVTSRKSNDALQNATSNSNDDLTHSQTATSIVNSNNTSQTDVSSDFGATKVSEQIVKKLPISNTVAAALARPLSFVLTQAPIEQAVASKEVTLSNSTLDASNPELSTLRLSPETRRKSGNNRTDNGSNGSSRRVSRNNSSARKRGGVFPKDTLRAEDSQLVFSIPKIQKSGPILRRNGATPGGRHMSAVSPSAESTVAVDVAAAVAAATAAIAKSSSSIVSRPSNSRKASLDSGTIDLDLTDIQISNGPRRNSDFHVGSSINGVQKNPSVPVTKLKKQVMFVNRAEMISYCSAFPRSDFFRDPTDSPVGSVESLVAASIRAASMMGSNNSLGDESGEEINDDDLFVTGRRTKNDAEEDDEEGDESGEEISLYEGTAGGDSLVPELHTGVVSINGDFIEKTAPSLVDHDEVHHMRMVMMFGSHNLTKGNYTPGNDNNNSGIFDGRNSNELIFSGASTRGSNISRYDDNDIDDDYDVVDIFADEDESGTELDADNDVHCGLDGSDCDDSNSGKRSNLRHIHDSPQEDSSSSSSSSSSTSSSSRSSTTSQSSFVVNQSAE